jgi:hypothetical protein
VPLGEGTTLGDELTTLGDVDCRRRNWNPGGRRAEGGLVGVGDLMFRLIEDDSGAVWVASDA